MIPLKTIIAYKVFVKLKNEPTKCQDYAEKFDVNISLVKSATAKLGSLGLARSYKGNVKKRGLVRIPKLTAKDFFERFQIKEIETFKKQVKTFLSNGAKKPKKTYNCSVCLVFLDKPTLTGFCKFCDGLGKPLNVISRPALCGHYSEVRYFKCEKCLPVLEDNDTEYDI